MAQIVRYGHGTHGADVGAAGVSHGNPDSRKKRRGNDTSRLTEDFSRVSCNDAMFEHQPMYLHVAEREPLAEYVSALQVVKRSSVFAASRGFESDMDFGIDSVMQRNAHDRRSLMFDFTGAPR